MAKVENLKEILSGKAKIKDMDFEWLPDSRDLIINSKKLNADRVTSLKKKYCIFNKNDENFEDWFYRVCISTKDFEKAFSKDYKEITKVLASIEKDKNAPVTVRHCYTPDGHGYYAVTKGDTRRFADSYLELQLAGGAWSYWVWRELYFFNAILAGYLEDLKNRLYAEYDNSGVFHFTMEISPLYMGYIATNFVLWYPEQEQEVKISRLKGDEKFLWDKFLMLPELLQAQTNFCVLHKDYLQKIEDMQSNVLAYNGDEDNNLFYAVEKEVHNAVNAIYKKRNKLENVGLWEDARAQIDRMNKIIYRRL